MTARFRIHDPAHPRVDLVFSPALEAVLSLHVLVEPKRHPVHHPWVRATRRRMPPEIRRLLSGYRFVSAGFLPPVLLPPPGPGHPSFDDELHRLGELGPGLGAAILSYFLGPSAPDDTRSGSGRAQLIERGRALAPATQELVRLGADSMQDLAALFLRFLVWYWDEGGFGLEWERVEDLLVRTSVSAQERIQRRGLFDWLRSLRPPLAVDETSRSFRVGVPDDADIDVVNQPLILVPSAFVWPCVAVVNDPPGRFGIAYPAPFSAQQNHDTAERETLVAALRALGHPVRMQVIELTAAHPRSTQELAGLLGMSEAALSAHLQKLTQVGILEPRRDGYYVLYHLMRETLGPVSASLAALTKSGVTEG